MRLRVADLLREHNMTPYALSKASGGRIGMNAAYRLAKGEFREISAGVLDALCDVFEIEDPGPLFERTMRGRTREAGRRRT